MRYLEGRHRLVSLATIALVMAAASATPAYAADEAAEAGPQDSGEIIVTANKREESLSKLGLAIKAVGASNYTTIDT